MLQILAAALLLFAQQQEKQRKLEARELKELLHDSWILFPDAMVAHSDIETFYSDGSYQRDDDNYEAHGSYRFVGQEVCVKADDEEAELCRSATVDAEGTTRLGGRRTIVHRLHSRS